MRGASVGAAWLCVTLLVACSGAEPTPTPRDGGARDAGPAAVDAAPRDGGRVPICGDGICDFEIGEATRNCPEDCPPPDFCPNGSEGCECRSSFAAGDVAFAQDDCESDLLCIPWDTLSGREAELLLPDQSCVRPCAIDADCGFDGDGAPRHCAPMDYPGADVSIGSICVDRLAPLDAYCGGSSNTQVLVRTRGARVKTDLDLVGCAGDAHCEFSASRKLNPDEGVCVQACGRPGDAACPPEAPYCNPELLLAGTSTAGLCSVGRLGFGALCDFSEDRHRAGLTSICDRAGPAPLACLGLQVIGIPAGVCIEECASGGSQPDRPCVSTDATNPVECRVLDAAAGDGVCVHTRVGLLPDTCVGDGTYGLGRVGFGVVFGDRRVPADWCVDRLAPVQAPGALDLRGNLVDPGDNCAARPLDEYRCPEPTLCAGDGAGRGVCVVGCSLVADPGYCGDALMTLGQTSTTAACVMTGTSTVVGLCGG